MRNTNILQTIGNTPVVELKRYSPKSKVRLFAKLEGGNPGGSVKDRVALYMVKKALKEGKLSPVKTIIEPTSGNTGIALAMLSAVFGYKFKAVMSESASIERRKLLVAYGADVILTDGAGGTNLAIKVTKEIIAKNPSDYVFLDQFSNPANVDAHYQTTGVELIKIVPEITHFVAGMGTGGTLMGVAKRLKEFSGAVKVIGVEPKPASKIQGLRNMTAYTPPVFDISKLDGKLVVDDASAFDLMKDLFTREGISVGISSGAALWGAIQVASNIDSGIVVTLFPDRGDRYASSINF